MKLNPIGVIVVLMALFLSNNFDLQARGRKGGSGGCSGGSCGGGGSMMHGGGSMMHGGMMMQPMFSQPNFVRVQEISPPQPVNVMTSVNQSPVNHLAVNQSPVNQLAVDSLIAAIKNPVQNDKAIDVLIASVKRDTLRNNIKLIARN